MYCRAEELTYPAIVEAIRQGRTFATNGGPVFPFVTIDGKGPGETLEPGGDRPHAVRAEVHCLYPLKSARLYRRGELGPSRSRWPGSGARSSWRRPSASGPAIGPGTSCGSRTSGATGPSPARSTSSRRGPPARPFASALILEISNATRYVELRRAFFAHLIVTVSPGDRLESVELLKDGRVVRRFDAGRGGEPDGREGAGDRHGRRVRAGLGLGRSGVVATSRRTGRWRRPAGTA